MFSSGTKISMSCKTFSNSGVLISPVIDINGLVLKADNIDNRVRAFFETKGATIQIIEENGKKKW